MSEVPTKLRTKIEKRKKQTVAIVGFGRFGKVLYKLFKDDFQVVLYDKNLSVFGDLKLTKDASVAKELKEVYRAKTVFYSVPIASFESVIKTHKKYFTDHLLVDVLSVKLHPEKVLKKHLIGTNARAILSHPMFGPDSSKSGFDGLSIVLNKFMAKDSEYNQLKKHFKLKGLTVVEISANEHDRLAANSQGVSHFVGRLLEKFEYKTTIIDTTGSKKLHDVMDLTVNDTWELFSNLQTYNPYTKKMRLKLGKAHDELYDELLPKRISKGKYVFGIQGGKGSFNEEALGHYVKIKNINRHETKYLYTTEKVLSELHRGNIDLGQFAIQNSVGGLVEESIRGMANYKFKIVSEFAIPIQHHLMKLKNTNIKDIKTIMTHPQVLRQCASSLKTNYPDLKLESGKGDLIDTAKAALALSNGELPKTAAILGPKVLSEIYGLEIVASNLQDEKTNNTTFLVVSR